jgi:hypothetical protein
MARLRSKTGTYDQGIIASSSAPSAAFIGQIWFNNATGVTYQWTSDGTSNFWLDISSGGIGTSASRGVDVVGDTDPHKAINPAGGVGSVYYNREKNRHFICTNATTNANIWSGRFDAVGGTVTDYESGGTKYRVHSFLTSGVFNVEDAITVDYLCIAGGGGGAQGYRAGGAGAGGYINSVDGETSGGGQAGSAVAALSCSARGSYTITVGEGGTGGYQNGVTPAAHYGNNGQNSSISGTGISTVTAIGGGGAGGGWTIHTPGANGGSGGGGGSWNISSNNNGGTGTANQGYAGGAGYDGNVQCGGGGGGAAGVGQPAGAGGTDGDGGPGLSSSITGAAVLRGGGGSGGNYDLGNTTDATHGGGDGSRGSGSTAGGNGTVNTGGGGGGSGGVGPGGNGGSGIVVLRYTLT